MEPNYSNYNLKELLEARDSIDKQAHPLRYIKICQEIEVKSNYPQEMRDLKQHNLFPKLVFTKVVMSLIGLFIASRLFTAFTEGYISWKGKTDYFVHQNPQTYYVLVAVHIFFLGFCIFMVFTNRWADKYNA